MQDGGRPRLLGVSWQFPVASETFIVDHLTAMADHGWAVSLCCVEADDERLAANRELLLRLDELVVLGRPNPIVRAGRLARGRPVASRQSRVIRHAAELGPSLRPVIDRMAPDVIHAYYGPNAAAVGRAQGDDPVPVIADLLGFDLTEVPATEGWSAYRRLLAGQRVVVHSRFAADQVRAGLGVEPTLVRSPVAPTFVPVERPRHWATPLALLFVGRLVPEKGADVAIEAVDLLDQRRSTLGAQLTIVGDGPERQALEDLARGRPVEFTGALASRRGRLGDAQPRGAAGPVPAVAVRLDRGVRAGGRRGPSLRDAEWWPAMSAACPKRRGRAPCSCRPVTPGPWPTGSSGCSSTCRG